MNTEDTLKAAVEALRAGKVILYPTDSVWGIGCDATNPEAVARVYEIKRRADSKSLVLLAGDIDIICRYVRQIPEIALQLLEVNDKPMTIIYPGAIVSDKPAVSGGQGESGSKSSASHGYGLAVNAVAEDGSVGIRIPLGGFCLDLARRFGRPLVSTSANISGEPTPKRFADISENIRSAVDFTVDPSFESGATGSASSIIKVGLDSTVRIIRK
ncbi:MAG: Sua5/YciO/YrdC/YwlC family protein [Bacteroidales bacterium]|nr:Sua5/YciO/YrdC/YwlC family protein [Bacteroidales bacterium]